MATPRQNKMGSKKMTDNIGSPVGASTGPNASPRPNPWGRNFASPSPLNNSRPLPMNGQASPASFPPLNPQPPKSTATSPRPGQDGPDSLIQTLTSLVNTQVMVFTHSGPRHQGTITSTVTEGENPGVNLKDVKDLLKINAPSKTSLFVPMKDILGYNPVNDKQAAPANGSAGAFRTDTDISNAGFTSPQARPGNLPSRERPLEVWQPPAATLSPDHPSSDALHGDALTFGDGSSGLRWDQFEANEQMFGVKTSFNEELYTTKLDRSRPDFKERERQAQIIADEILGGVTSNPHLAEERGRFDDSGMNEEDKYGAVVRSPGAYVPPGARGGQSNATAPSSNAVPPPSTTLPVPTITKQEGGSKVTIVTPDSSAAATPAPVAPGKGADGLVNDFRSFVKNEKTRLTEKKQALAKSDMDKRKAELLKFSQSFKLNKPIPDDLVTILAKDQDKQKAIKEKSMEDAASGTARVIGPSITATTASKKAAAAAASGAAGTPPKGDAAKAPTQGGSTSTQGTGVTTAAAGAAVKPVAPAATMAATTSAAASGKPASKAPVKKLVPRMVLQPIPPFNPNKARGATAASVGGSASASPPPAASGALTNSVSASNADEKEKEKEIGTSASAASRLNINAHSFQPNNIKPSASQASGSSTSSQKASEPPTSAPANNAFFGTRVLNKKPVHLKEEFNPFKRDNKLPEPSSISERWPYTGKRYLSNFGPVPSWMLHGPGPHLGGAAGAGGNNPAGGAGSHMGAPMPGGASGAPPPPAAMAATAVAGAAGAAGGQGGYEEDPNRAAAAAAAGYMYYTPYHYPGQMIPGVPPPPGYMHPQYMQAIPYPPNMGPPNGPPMYPPMPGMPPPHFMPPPPGPYVQPPPPPPNGTNGHGHGPRPSMPTPVPSHAHPYPYHHSPQMQHAVPYHPTMIMQGHHPGAGGPPPPQGGPPPHMYDGPPSGAGNAAGGGPPSNSSGGQPGGPVPGSTNSGGGNHSHHNHNQHQHHNHSHSHTHTHSQQQQQQQQQQQPGHPPHPPHHHPSSHQSPTSLGMMTGHS